MQKAIEKRVDNLLSQSPKALAAMASQITDDTLASIMKGSSEEDAMAALTEFMHKYVKPMDARTYHEYRDEYELLREHYWMNLWLKAETKLAESRRDYLRMLKAALTAIKAGDHMREYIGIPASDVRESFDVDAALDQVAAELEKAETTVREWYKPDMWQLIGYEPGYRSSINEVL